VLCLLHHVSGQVPVGQEELPLEAEPDETLALNAEKTFSTALLPHFSQACFSLLPGLSNTSVT